jgi:photosystem II stability/assembly factor-like uncharacterized protein
MCRSSDTLKDIWGSSSSDVYAVAIEGAILHYDGTTWNTMNSGSGNTLRAVWGTSSSDAFVVGDEGTVLHYDGK